MSCLQAIHYHKFETIALLSILEKCHSFLTSHKKVKFCWLPSHVGIRGNEKADAAAKAAIQLPVSLNIQIHYTDLKHSINTFFIKTWQDQWNQTTFNKLQIIKPSIGYTKLKNITHRRDEVVLHRARIGHTHLTHSYLLKRENNPDCNICNCLRTVQHILIDCPNYTQIRVKYFVAATLAELFTKINPTHIINFLKEIKLYNTL